MKGVPAKDFKPDDGARGRLSSKSAQCPTGNDSLAGQTGTVSYPFSSCMGEVGKCTSVVVGAQSNCWPLSCLTVIGGTATAKADGKVPESDAASVTLACGQEIHAGDWVRGRMTGRRARVVGITPHGLLRVHYEGEGAPRTVSQDPANYAPAKSRKPKVGDVVDVSRRYGGGAQTSLTIRSPQACTCCDWRGTDGDGDSFTFKEEDIIRYHN